MVNILCLLLLSLEYHRALFLVPFFFFVYINDLTEISLRAGAKITLYEDGFLLF